MFENVQKRRAISFSPCEEIIREAVPEIPDGVYEKCPGCESILRVEELRESLMVCPKCDHHFRIGSVDRIAFFFSSFAPFDSRMRSQDPLAFPGYSEKLRGLYEKTGLLDTVVCGDAVLDGHEVVGVVMDPMFLMGSMGSVAGEKITHSFERAMRYKKPVLMFSASGGARMQEGMISLMQMAKTAGAVGKFGSYGGLFINVLTDPTTGGVTASFAMLGDIILAEPNALIGFAGPRVIEQTVRQKPAPNFQRSEFLLEKGFVDKVVHRRELKKTLSTLLTIHSRGRS